MNLLSLLAILSCGIFHLAQSGNQQKSVLLASVQTLTLHKGQRTQARRVSAVPQLKCIGGSAKGTFEPDVVQCYNRGSDGADIQWECTSEMPKKYKFGKISVSCEGYDYPEDPYILAGSCGLEYNLELTDKNYYDSRQSQNVRQSSSWTLLPFLIKIGMMAGVFMIVRSYLSGNRPGGVGRMAAGPDHRPPGGGGGGGWFSNFFPGGFGGFGGGPGHGTPRGGGQPPPAGFRTDFTNPGFDNADCHTNRQANAGTGGFGNFFTGAALGALGGYAFGGRNRRANNQYMPNTGNAGWFGGGGGGGATNTYRRDPSPASGSTHTSSGFGGTTRR